MKPTLTFVPNEYDTQTNDDRIRFRAEQYRQDPETVVVVPFSELEGTVLTQVDSGFSSDGEPVPMDVAGDVLIVHPDNDRPSSLGETLVDELETFDPPTSSEIERSGLNTHIVGEYDEQPSILIDSDETMTAVEKKATGEPVGK